ncbi:MAG TPA: hypothetical protein VKD47_07430 [Miltoncostaeaceae bacterium]|nr:hypothetical protein [Miltoncostaeaceae bacterium]
MTPGPAESVGAGLPEGIRSAFGTGLAEAVLSRRSRRFGLGMTLPDGPLAYVSEHPALPLSELEEAFLVWVGTGVTGLALAELPPDGIAWMHGFSGRAWPCSCNSHSTELFYTNDAGLHLVRLGEETPDRVSVFAGMGEAEALGEMLARLRASTTTLEAGRADLPRGEPGLFDFNAWNVNQPGTTLFIPVTNTTIEYLTLLFIYFDEKNRFAVVDEHAGGARCGLDRWIASGRLGAVEMSLVDIELRVLTTLNVEGAFICQNMSLALQALGLGGWAFTGFLPHHVLGADPGHRGLGFRFVTPSATVRSAARPAPVGRDGVLEALCPPYVPDMATAVRRYLDGWLAGAEGGSAYARPESALAGRTPPTEETIEIVTAFCTYVLETHGRFPAFIDPMFVRLVLQAHHLDLDFYDRHYPGDAVSARHRDHMRLWHPDGGA